MSAASARCLKRLEEATAPRDLGQYHCIYARDGADFERQKADLIASGRAKATDLIFDANWQSLQQRGWDAGLPEYVGEVREPETFPWTTTWEEFLDQEAAEERQKEMAR
jgi:hypothetical protein